MANPDVFSETTAASSGPLSGYFLWSYSANWSAGIPTTGISVNASGTSYDDLAVLSLNTLTESDTAQVLVTGASLDIQTVQSSTDNAVLDADGLAVHATTPVVVTVGTITGSGSYAATGATSEFIDNSATDSGNYFSVFGGGTVELAAAPSAGSFFDYAGDGTFAFENPGSVTTARLYQVAVGDVLELPGTSVSNVTFSTNSLSVTTSAGTFSFTNVTYSGSAPSTYTSSFDSKTGLEAITFTSPDIFEATSGTWSNAANWSAGVPANGANVDIAANAFTTDDLANVTLTSLTEANLNSTVGVTEGTLDVGTFNGTGEFYTDGGANTAIITVGAITGQGATYGAVGANSVFIDNSATDPGYSIFEASSGGTVELASAPNGTSSLYFDTTGGSSTVALENPGSTISAQLANVAQGDVLELPGNSAAGAAFATNNPGSFSITTSAGTFSFDNVTYSGLVDGYTTSFDAKTGLEAITFMSPDVFQATSGTWSNPANWSGGVPVNGANVDIAANAFTTDDLANVTLTSLTEANRNSTVGVTEGTLDVGTFNGTGEFYTDGGANTAIITVGAITGQGATYGAVGANSVFIDNSATDPGYSIFEASSGGTVELASAPNGTSSLYFDTTGGSSTVALENPGSTISAQLANVAQGDVLELPGNSAAGASFSTNNPGSFSITTSAGTFSFDNVSYSGLVDGYTTSFDAKTGLEAITFTSPDVFSATNNQLWSNAANWSGGVPTTGTSVVASGISYDDLGALSLNTLTESDTADVLVTGASLNIQTVQSSTDNDDLAADGFNVNATTPVVVTVGTITGNGSYGANGATSEFIDNSATDSGNYFSVFGGGTLELAAAPSSGSIFDYTGGASAGTFAFEHPGSVTGAKLLELSAGDSLELPGTSVSNVTFGANSLSVTTSAGTFSFTNVSYSDSASSVPSTYSSSFDSKTGLEEITFGTPNVFSARSGTLWSTAANWSTGVPANGTGVSAATSGNDDLSSLALTTLSLQSNVAIDVTDGALTVNTVGGLSNTDLIASGGVNPATAVPIDVTVGMITGTGGTYGAAGAKSVFVDNSTTDTGNFYYATAGGKFVLAATPVAASYLAYDEAGTPSTIALEHPGAVTNAPLENLSNGDVLELPGSSVSGVTFGSGSLSVTTSAGTFAFNDVNYLTQYGQLNGYTASFDAATGLEAITFTAPDVFTSMQGEKWSTAANWSAGVPVNGSSVQLAGTSVDDLSSLSLSSLIASSQANLQVQQGTLSIGTVNASTIVGAQLSADGGLTPGTTVPVIVTVDALTGSGTYGAEGAKSVFIDNAASDPGNTFFYADSGGMVEIASHVAGSSVLDFSGPVGSPGTFALENPGELTGAAVKNLAAGDTLELAGTSIISVVIGSNYLNITTNAGEFVFDDVTYSGVQVTGYSSSLDSRTGLEAITFTTPDVFNSSNGGLWSTPASWSDGVPLNGSNVVASGGIDDLSNLALASLTGNGTGITDVNDGVLTVGTVNEASGGELEAYGSGNPAIAVPVTVTVGAMTGMGGTYGAEGAKSFFVDNSANDPGATTFFADAGGTVELASRVAASSFLDFSGAPGSPGTIALENPGELITARLEGVSGGDVLELPGTSVTSVIYGANTLNVTTNAGEFVFNNVSYSEPGQITGYTSGIDSRTGLEAITFLTPDVFTAVSGTLWSTPANWSQGVPPNGSSVELTGASQDDLSNLTVASVSDGVQGSFTSVTDGTLSAGTVNETSGDQLQASGGLDAATITVGALTGTGGTYGADGVKSLFVDNSATDPGNTTFFASGGGTTEIASRPATSSVLDFSGAPGSPGTLALENPGELTNSKLEGVTGGDVLELPGSSVTSVVIGSNYLNITTNAGEFVFTDVSYDTSGSLVDGYTAARDATTGLEAITFVACYLSGTSILTDRGEVAVERLTVGDVLITASGGRRPVRWLGSRRLDCSRYADPALVWPIRIRAGAFATGLPLRDLWVSPGHSLLIDGVLIQAERLVNGVTVIREPRSRVEYWHVELDSHDVILAEGLPAESYLDTGNRTAFADGGAYLEAHPDFSPKHWSDTCVPLVTEGEPLVRAKGRLLARAQELGFAITGDGDVHVEADGVRLEPVTLGECRVAFMLPADCRSIDLVSRTFVPAHIQAASQDSRALGLCVGRLQVDGTQIALDDERSLAHGWHALETHAQGHRQRWTTGRTPLPAGSRLIVIDIAGRSYHWTTPPVSLWKQADEYQERAGVSAMARRPRFARLA